MILLDTNVLSELIRPIPASTVEAWVRAQPAATLFISAVTEAELRFGLALLPDGRRRDRLAEAVAGVLVEEFAGRILLFDSAAALAYARIAAGRRRAGRPIAQFDAQIAAIAHSRGAILATRNTADFNDCGIPLINPWHTVA